MLVAVECIDSTEGVVIAARSLFREDNGG